MQTLKDIILDRLKLELAVIEQWRPSNPLVYKCFDNGLYYTMTLLLACIASFDLGLLIGYIMGLAL
jgi:hypothetical protein